MLSADLSTLGFTPNQIQIYDYLLTHTPAKAAAIVRHLKINRAVVYKTLDELIAKRLVGKTLKGGVAEYTVLTPKALEE